MATVAERRERAETKVVRRERPRRKRSRLWMVVVLLLLLAAWFAPWIVAHTRLADMIVSRAMPGLAGELTAGSLSLGWLSSVEIDDLKLADTQGKTLVRVPTVRSEKSLAALLLDRSDLGHFDIEQPVAEISLRPDGSDLEDALRPWLSARKPSDDSASVSFTITDGKLVLHDGSDGRTWTIDDVRLASAMPAAAGESWTVDLEATVADQPQPSSLNLSARFEAPQPAATSEQSSTAAAALPAQGNVTLAARSLPLAIVESLVERFQQGTQLAGHLNANLKTEWQRGAKETITGSLDGDLAAKELRMSGPWLADELQLASLSLPVNVRADGDTLHVDRCELNCDVAQLNCQGTIQPLSRLVASQSAAAITSALARSTGKVNGTIDLAALAARLPNTLRVREGTSIDSGTVNISLASQAAGDAWQWTGQVGASQLVATAAGKQIVWEHPLLAEFDAQDTPQGLVVRQLKGESDFIHFTGAGSRESFDLDAQYDLARLAEELNRFFDLGEFRLAGQGQARLAWREDAGGAFLLDSAVEVDGFELNRPGRIPWTEARLNAIAQTSGRLVPDQPPTIDRARFELTSGDDLLNVNVDPRLDGDRPSGAPQKLGVVLRAQGRLARWHARLEPWVALPADMELDGQLTADAAGEYDQDTLHLDSSRIDLQQLHVRTSGWYIDEPQVQLTCAATWNTQSQSADIDEATFVAGNTSAQVKAARFELASADGWRATGSASLDGQLGHLQRWMTNPDERGPLKLKGRIMATAQLARADAACTAALNASIKDFAAVPQQGEPWREPEVRLASQMVYRPAQETLTIDRVELTASALRLIAAGKIAGWQSQPMLNLDGKLAYNLAQLSSVLEAYLGPGVRFEGNEERSFRIAGPLPSAAAPQDDNWLRQLQANAELGWQSGEVYGFAVGKADVRAAMADGTIRLVSLEIPVSQGMLKAEPLVRLAPGPAELLVPQGAGLRNVQISPEMCNQWLMYVAPVAAGVTRARGSFSVDMAGCRIPLTAPKTGTAEGVITVHQVQLGPGPMVAELAQLLGKTGEVGLKRESHVEFRMVDGRVYHRNLELQFPTITVKTYGSVGLDGTLAIVAEMPVPEKWIGDGPIGQALRNQTIQLPIGGTLEKPKFDRRAVDDLAKKFLRDASGNVLRDGLNTLDRILPRQPAQPSTRP